MNDNVTNSFEAWRANLRQSRQAAAEKKASALNAVDCTDNGTVSAPSNNTEATRSNLNLPTNPTSNKEQDKDGTHGLCTTTNPNGVGQGDYPKAVDGNAKDEAFTSPSTPLSKIAGDLRAASEPAAEPAAAQEDKPTTAAASEKTAAAEFQIPADVRSDASIMSKMAYCTYLMMQTQEGMRTVNDVLTKEAGRNEAQRILTEVQVELEKEASANAQVMTQEELTKEAAFNAAVDASTQAHVAWINSFGTELEKRAYMQGAMDGDAMATAAQDPAAQAEMGDSAIPADDSQVTDEEIMAAIQALLESGEVTQDQVNQFIQNIANDQRPAYDAATLAQMLSDDVNSGVVPPEAAEQIAAEILQGIEQGTIPMGGEQAAPEAAAAQEQAAVDPSAMEVQASVNRTADLVNSL